MSPELSMSDWSNFIGFRIDGIDEEILNDRWLVWNRLGFDSFVSLETIFFFLERTDHELIFVFISFFLYSFKKNLG